MVKISGLERFILFNYRARFLRDLLDMVMSWGESDSLNLLVIQFCVGVAANEQDGSIKSWWCASTEGESKVTVWIFIFVCDTCWTFGHASGLSTWRLRANIECSSLEHPAPTDRLKAGATLVLIQMCVMGIQSLVGTSPAVLVTRVGYLVSTV